MTPELSAEVLEAADAVENRVAEAIASLATEAIEARGRFLLAVSGGHTPWVMLRALAAAQIPWPAVRVFQVDERVTPSGHADRNLTHLKEGLLWHAPLRPEQILAMPVESEDLDRAAAEYAQTLQRECSSPAVLDLATSAYQGRCRMTLTYPGINSARHILWVVTGAEKVQMLDRLLHCDADIPAGHVGREKSLVPVDFAAVGGEQEESLNARGNANRSWRV